MTVRSLKSYVLSQDLLSRKQLSQNSQRMSLLMVSKMLQLPRKVRLIRVLREVVSFKKEIKLMEKQLPKTRLILSQLKVKQKLNQPLKSQLLKKRCRLHLQWRKSLFGSLSQTPLLLLDNVVRLKTACVTSTRTIGLSGQMSTTEWRTLIPS